MILISSPNVDVDSTVFLSVMAFNRSGCYFCKSKKWPLQDSWIPSMLVQPASHMIWAYIASWTLPSCQLIEQSIQQGFTITHHLACPLNQVFDTCLAKSRFLFCSLWQVWLQLLWNTVCMTQVRNLRQLRPYIYIGVCSVVYMYTTRGTVT